MFSWSRFIAITLKEFIQMRRDRLTFAMMVGIPLIQLILFGYAINMTPRHLPTALLTADNSAYTRTIIRGLSNTNYFKINFLPKSELEADELLARGKVLFVINIPPNFTDRLLRNHRPQILLEADATDPVTLANAASAAQTLSTIVLNTELEGVTQSLQNAPTKINFIVHAKYNPEQITQYNIVPGLLGVVVTMTLTLIMSMAVTRERERGTLENLLATPVRPAEVMLGKIIPYIIVGYIQVILILLASKYLFGVPIKGSLTLLFILTFPFITANLAMGLTFSSLAKTQLQAAQMSFFFFLPSLLISGFMFPFYGMPLWAQWLGDTLPLTHYLNITRGILLKGNSMHLLWTQLFAILIFMVVALAISIIQYKQTLD